MLVRFLKECMQGKGILGWVGCAACQGVGLHHTRETVLSGRRALANWSAAEKDGDSDH